MYTLKFDGNYREIKNPKKLDKSTGVMCYGWLIYHDGQLVAKGHGGVADSKNANYCITEYLALIEGFEALVDMGIDTKTPVLILGDAKSIIEQMQGLSMVSSETIKPYYRRAKKLFKQHETIYWVWLPRKYNKDADKLCTYAMKRVRSNKLDQAAFSASAKHTQRKRGAANPYSLLDLRVYTIAT